MKTINSLAILVVSLFSFSAQSAEFTVDSLNDTVDANTADNLCSDVLGKCTLRAAIHQAHFIAGATAITVPGGTITLTIAPSGNNDIQSGDLNLPKEITITGSNDANSPTIIDGNKTDRIFKSDFTDQNISLAYLGLQNGKITNNSGGAIYVGVGGVNSQFLVDHCILRNNVALGGGAIYGSFSNGGVINISNSEIRDNQAPGNTYGGGIWNAVGNLVLQNTVIDNNTAKDGGGLVVHFGTASVVNSEITNNKATGGTGGGGVYIDTEGSAEISNSLIDGNSSNAYGGGVLISSPNKIIVLNNTTVSNNQAKHSGGGIIQSGGTLYLNSATIVSNTADSDKDAFGTGGGLDLEVGDTFAQNTLIANNTANAEKGNDCKGILTTSGYNLIEDESFCPLSGDLEHAVTGQDPQLMNLAANGGGTRTFALGANSPALDAGHPDGCSDQNNVALTTDQRGTGFARAINGRCDIGAFESACGDGITSGHEECDDANEIDTDMCLATCVVATCGDGLIQAGVEQCDNAGANSNSVADSCRTSCVNPACGDAVVDSGETCDDGNLNAGDSCNGICQIEIAPEEPVVPDQPAEPTQPKEPVQPVAPTQPEEPVQPVAPTQPEDTGTTGDETTDSEPTTEPSDTETADQTTKANASSNSGGGCQLNQNNPKHSSLFFVLIGLITLLTLRSRNKSRG